MEPIFSKVSDLQYRRNSTEIAHLEFSQDLREKSSKNRLLDGFI